MDLGTSWGGEVLAAVSITASVKISGTGSVRILFTNSK